MLQMSLRWRLIGAIASFVLAVVLTIWLGFGYSFIFWIIFLVFVVGYFLLGTISAAAKKLNTGQMDEAEKILGYTIKPNWLLKVNQAYYHMLKGTIALQRNQLDEGKEYFEIAQEKGLATDNDKAMVLMNLANINYSKRKFTAAKSQIQQIKALAVTEPMIKDKIAEMEQALKVRPSGMTGMMYGKQGRRAMQKATRVQQQGARKPKNNRKKKKRK